MRYLDIAKRLMDECGWNRAIAEAFAWAGGKCEYCGCDLLHDRLRYAVGELDHLLPKAKYPDLEDETDNWVLACRLCNTIKGRHDLSEGMTVTKESLNGDRPVLIAKARKFIYGKRADGPDTAWIEVKGIMDMIKR